MVTLPLVALLFFGTITLFTEAQRVVQRTSVAVQSSQDAATGLQYITGMTREAIQFALPPDTAASSTNGMGFVPLDGRLSDYESGSYNTAVELLLPGNATSLKAGDRSPSAGFNVLDASGDPLDPAPSGYDRTVIGVSGGQLVSPLQGDLICIYRGDSQGNPSPSSGQYLWAARRPAGTLVADGTHDVLQRLCRLVLTQHADGTPATDAVQFVGRNTPGADIPASMAYELEFKLVCGDRTSISGTQTNEAGDGSSLSTLEGKCALLRNHN